MLYTLENETAVLCVDTYACEIRSFRRKDKEIEYMWNGDPAFWSGRNPVLFPHVSSPKNKILNIKGKDCKVNNHGFCRRSEFEFMEQGEDFLLFRLTDDAETYAQYPYRFELLVKYTLKQNQVFIDYRIVNKDEEDMYFGFGQHPAFNCPLVPEKTFSDYWIEFEKEDVEGRKLDLSYELFEKYPTYIVKDPESRVFTLTDGENKVVMRISDQYRIFALWTPHAPFVCLEPWVNTLDGTEDVPFEERPGNITLSPKEEYRIGYSFEII
ncbi:MAG: aldose 1-epimerase family protein [Erysipelotrichaceae bacterium]|nr:aldose 1-epimerase family protein [Erysipelotrichaceae bacterium]